VTADERRRRAMRAEPGDASARARARREVVRVDPCPICHEVVADAGFPTADSDEEHERRSWVEPICCCRRCWGRSELGHWDEVKGPPSSYDPSWAMWICTDCPRRGEGSQLPDRIVGSPIRLRPERERPQ